jgi:CTP synthase (UTP-ammonia lyase)
MLQVGIIGDYDATEPTHTATSAAIVQAGDSLGELTGVSWISTTLLAHDTTLLDACDAIVASPGTPYADFDGALAGIRYAREYQRPFLGTCGGFQHALLEHARHCIGLRAASTAEISPDGDELVVTPMACSMFGETGTVTLLEGTRVYAVYGRSATREPYRCHYSLNPMYRDMILNLGMVASGVDGEGEIRVIERTDHPFFVATLFVPQLSDEQPHPVFRGLLRAALAGR